MAEELEEIKNKLGEAEKAIEENKRHQTLLNEGLLELNSKRRPSPEYEGVAYLNQVVQ